MLLRDVHGCEKCCSSSADWGFAACLETVEEWIFHVAYRGISIEGSDGDRLLNNNNINV